MTISEDDHARIQEAAKRVVAQAPPLTEERLDEIAALLRPIERSK